MSQVQPSPWIAVGDRLPPELQEVLVLLACPDVAIDAHPTVARLQIEFRGTPSERCDWWAGVPGKWMAIRPGGDWVVTHWSRLPEYDDFHRPTRAAAWDRWTRESGVLSPPSLRALLQEARALWMRVGEPMAEDVIAAGDAWVVNVDRAFGGAPSEEEGG